MAEKFKNDEGTGGLLGNVVGALEEDVISLGSSLANIGTSSHKYMTGSRAVIKVNGKLLGFAHSASYRINTDYVENNTIDDFTPYELMPTRITVSGQLGMFHIPGKGVTKELIQSNILSFLHHRYIGITIRDRKTDNLIFQTEKAVITEKYEELKAGELTSVVLTFKAIGWVDEMVPAFPSGHDGGEQESGGLIDDIGGAIKDFFT